VSDTASAVSVERIRTLDTREIFIGGVCLGDEDL
jgi:hypothetical protein